jgi:two-component system, OmpR family, alkaline phosphatase synthesis response regulator PhoP
MIAPLTSLLIVEDDPEISRLLADFMRPEGFEVECADSGKAMDAVLQRMRPDLVVLDLMLPHVDGLEVCRAIRSNPQSAAVPIIMLTARSEESDRIVGLELGADDYVAKPFGPNELVARVRALLRRTHRQAAVVGRIDYGSILVDTDQHTVLQNGKPVTLTAKEFLLLEYLLKHRGRVLSRDVLLTDVWGYKYTGGTRTVDVHVRRLREKLPQLSGGLVTVKQFGYKLLDSPPA